MRKIIDINKVRRSALADLFEMHAKISELEPRDIAGLYLDNKSEMPNTREELQEAIKFAEKVDAGGYRYGETVEQFAYDLYIDTAESEEVREMLEELAYHIDWRKVWETELKHDWIRTLTEDNEFLFVMDF
jgi:DNA-dependent RNA polymerase auxiliary subunit epsilon